MQLQERRESEPQAFNRKACIQYAVQKFRPRFSSLQKSAYRREFIETKFLKSEIDREKSSYSDFLPASVDRRVEGRLLNLSLQNQTLALSDERLDQLQRQTSEEIGQIGNIVYARAKDFGIAKPVKKSGSPGTVDAITLEQIFLHDPDFVKEQVIRYHELHAFSDAVRAIRFGLALHQAEESIFLPDYLRLLSPDSKQRAMQIEAMLTFLQLVNNMGYPIRTFGLSVLEKIDQKKIFAEGKSEVVDTYLMHRVLCPAETGEDREYVESLLAFYARSREIERSGRLLRELTRSDRSILRNPLVYTDMFIQGQEETARKDRKNIVAFAEVLQTTQGKPDVQTYLQELQARTPENYKLLERFKKWIATGEYGEEAFDLLVNNIASDLQHHFSDISTNTINDILERNLTMAALIKEHFPGVSKNPENPLKIKIDNELLSDIIVVLALKTAQNNVNTPPLDSVRREKRIILPSLEELEERFMTTYAKKIRSANIVLSKLGKQKATMKRFLTRQGMSAETVEAIAQAAKNPKRNLPEGVPSYSMHGFIVAFNILYLSSKQGVDTKSPFFRSFVDAVFPFFKENKLRNMV